MNEKRVEAIQLALLELLENKGPAKCVMGYDFKMKAPKDLTEDEYETAIGTLAKNFFINIRGNGARLAFERGPAYLKWRNEVIQPQKNIFNVSGNTFSSATQFGTGNVLDMQINETDSKEIIKLIEALVQRPESKEKATPILDALKSGAIETAKDAICYLIKSLLTP